jgi:hypothetical protein
MEDDIEAARRRLRRRIINTLRTPTTQPTKIALSFRIGFRGGLKPAFL